MSDKILPCPNPKCRNVCRVTESGWGRGWYEVICGDSGDFCGYNGPLSKTKEGAIEGHNALCRPTGVPMGELEALAKSWDNWADTHLDGAELEVAVKCHGDLKALLSRQEKKK